VSVPSAGNAAGATSAYAAAAGMPCHVYMPKDVPMVFRVECQELGANVTLVDGLINDCGKLAKEDAKRDPAGRFDLSTLKEPYRLEGKKTMGYELAEQFMFDLPDVIIYPTGGGTGLGEYCTSILCASLGHFVDCYKSHAANHVHIFLHRQSWNVESIC
jgi:threonine synthase